MELINFNSVPQPVAISFGEQKVLPFDVALQIFMRLSFKNLNPLKLVNREWHASVYSLSMLTKIAIHCLIPSIPHWILIHPNVIIPSEVDPTVDQPFADRSSYKDFKKGQNQDLHLLIDLDEPVEQTQDPISLAALWRKKRLLSIATYDFSLDYQGGVSHNAIGQQLERCPRNPEMKITWQQHLPLTGKLFTSKKSSPQELQLFRIRAVFEKVYPNRFYHLVKRFKSKDSNLLLRLHKIELVKVPNGIYHYPLNQAVDYVNGNHQAMSEDEDKKMLDEYEKLSRSLMETDE